MSTVETKPVGDGEEAEQLTVREMAIDRLRKRSDFWMHFAGWAFVNVSLIIVWLMFTPDAFFWPVFPLVGWGVGVFFHGWDTFRAPVSEARIRREMQRLEGDPPIR